jgi:hypothetical protein
MKEKINIADILKDKPVGLKFYSNTFGYISFNGVHKDKVYFFSEDTNAHSVKPNGKMYDGGECIIFPSKEMRDWEKFSWKKGDVLISDCGFMCIFKEWASDDYTKFNGCYFDGMPNTETAKYSKVDNNIAYGYIRDIENKCGGRLNLETLEIEKQTGFKDGDIVVYGKSVAICRRIYKHTLSFYVSLNEMFGLLFADEVESSEEYRFATEEEKQQLFDALEKEGKAWDAEKKQIVDIKKEHQFKPFEKVLVRDSIDDVWRASFFSHIKENDGRYVTTCVTWKFCIPYIGNESLLGTTKDVEG